MKTIYQIKYEVRLFFKGTKCIMPLIGMAILMYILYSVKPQQVVDGLIITSLYIYICMLCLGNLQLQTEDETMEHVLFLRINSPINFYIGKALSLSCISLIFSLAGTLFPVFINIVNGGDMFVRDLTLIDLINGFVIMSFAGICGAAVGNTFPNRSFHNKKVGILFTSIIGILSIVKFSLIQDFAFLKYILWLIPSGTIGFEKYGNVFYFDFKSTIIIVGTYLLYSLGYFALKSILCLRNS